MIAPFDFAVLAHNVIPSAFTVSSIIPAPYGEPHKRGLKMKVLVKELNAEIELKTSGMELQVHDNNGKHLGDLVVNKSRLEWCDGRTHVGNGVQISWTNFIAYANGLKAAPAKKAPAAKKAVAKKAAAKKVSE